MNLQKGIAVLFSIVVLGFSVTGCGGGGGGSSVSTPLESERAILDENNSEQAISALFNVVDLGFEPSLPLTKSVGETSTSTTNTLTQAAALNQLRSIAPVKNEAVTGEQIACTDGGFITTTNTGATFSNCNESGIIMDGTMTVSGTETAATATLSNFSMILEGETIFYESLTFSFTLNAESQINSMSITMDGYTSIFGERIDYQNYTFAMSMDNFNAITFSINGFIKTDCLGGWVELSTTEDIQINDTDPCPNAGQIVISGNSSSLTVDFNSDGSVDLSGAVTEHYSSCTNVPDSTCSL